MDGPYKFADFGKWQLFKVPKRCTKTGTKLRKHTVLPQKPLH